MSRVALGPFQVFNFTITEVNDALTRLVNRISLLFTPNLMATTTWDPASLASGASTTTTVGVPGAVAGDVATAGFSGSLGGCFLSASVADADTVTVVLANLTGSPVNVAAGTLRVVVFPL